MKISHCVKKSKYGVFSGPNTGKYGPEKTPYFDTIYAVSAAADFIKLRIIHVTYYLHLYFGNSAKCFHQCNCFEIFHVFKGHI